MKMDITHYKNLSIEDVKGELWLQFKPNYFVSNLGRIKSIERKVNTWNGYKSIPTTILKQRNRGDYLVCNKFGTVHTIVAKAFIANTENKPQVNHRFGNKKDNKAVNLEWATSSENIIHAWNTGLMNDNTRRLMSEKAKLRIGNKNSCWRSFVIISDLSGNFICKVESLVSAVIYIRENTKFKSAGKGNISKVCNGQLNSIYGFKFKYDE